MAINTNVGPERVEVSDKPLGTVQVPGAGISTATVLISSKLSSAPANTPTSVTDLESFVETFGGPDDMIEDGYYAVKGYFENAGTGNTALIVNVPGTAATGTITVTADASLSGATVTVDGTTLTEGEEWTLTSSDDDATAASLSSAIDSEVSSVSASVDGNVITITSDTLGEDGNDITLTSSDATNLSTSGSNLTGGAKPTATDYQGTAANAEGLRSLDAQDSIGQVMVPGLPLEKAYLVDPSVVDYTETVRGAFGNTLTDAFSLLAIPKEISLANEEEDAATGAKFESSSSVTGGFDIVVDDGSGGSIDLSGVTAGMLIRDSGDSFSAVISDVDDANDTLTVLTDPASTFTDGDDVLIKKPSAISYKEEVVNNPSRFSAWYFNNLVVLDQSENADAGDTVITSPLGHVAGVMARIDANVSIGGPSHAPAGIQFAGLAGIQALSLSISERKDGGPLRLNYVNRITSFPGAGNVVFGGYTAESGTSPVFTADEQLVQVMRTLQFIKLSLEPGLRRFLWENFSPETQGQIASAIQSFLRSNIHLFPAGLPESQQFRVISVDPTQDELDQGLLKVRVQVKPNKAVLFVDLTLEFPIPDA